MAHELVVIGIGDLRQQDRGLSIQLLESLKQEFRENSIKFIDGGINADHLFELLKELSAKKILVLETIEASIEPGKLNYLLLTPQEPKTLEFLLLVSIEIVNRDWGAALSPTIINQYQQILNNLKDVLNRLLSG